MDGCDHREKIGRVAEMIVAAGAVVVFTGAGVSTESGIPDFRGPGGLWTKFDPDDFTIERFRSDPETRRKQWRFLLSGELFGTARPNAAHTAIAELGRIGKVRCVITQNIDHLHQQAGSDPEAVFELHGNIRFVDCMACGARYPLEQILGGRRELETAPVCGRCSGILKPGVVFFGEPLPEQALSRASWHAGHCDLLIVVGSSLAVYPAAYMPLYARQGGARLVVVNLSPTPVDAIAEVVIRAGAGETMGRIAAEVGRRLVRPCA